MIFRLLYRLVNLITLACYAVGSAAISTFITNTRFVGLRDFDLKLPLILASSSSLPFAALAHTLFVGGPFRFLSSVVRRSGSVGWLWRVLLTLHGARYLLQEFYRWRYPRPMPPEVLRSWSRVVDMRNPVAQAEGIKLSGLKGLAFNANDLYQLNITTHEVRLDRLPREFDGFTIVQVSDVHYGDFTSAEFVRRYVQLVQETSPDLVALTGDYQQFHHDVADAARLLAPLGEWSCRERGGQGTVAVLGNHDTWASTADVTYYLSRARIPVLDNRHIEIKRGGSSLYVAGVADPWSLRADLPLALHGIPQGACVVLLAHEPDFLLEAAETGIDFQLSGHIHGGQIKLPLIGPLFSPSRFNRRYTEGFYKRNRTIMYMSRGIGGHPPIRLFCKPEIAVFKLRSK